MIKKILLVGAGMLLLIGLLTGRAAVSYVRTAADKVEDQFKRNVPVKFEIERARRMLKDLAPDIERNVHVIAREEVEVVKLERELAGHEKDLARSRDEILRLKGDLESGESHLVYAGRSYSAQEVKADLANRFQHFQTVEATVDQLKKVLRARENGLHAAREKLEKMLTAKRQLAVEIENLEARLKMVEVAQTSSEFNFDDSQLARTRELISEIGTRLDVTEKLMNQRVQLSDRIPLERHDLESEDLLETITRHFSTPGEPEEKLADARIP